MNIYTENEIKQAIADILSFPSSLIFNEESRPVGLRTKSEEEIKKDIQINQELLVGRLRKNKNSVRV